MTRGKVGKVVVLLLAVVLCMANVACTDTQLQKAATLSKDFRLTVAAAQDIEITLYRAGKIEHDTHIIIQQSIIDVSHVGDEVNSAIRVAKSKPAALAAVRKGLDATERLLDNGVLKVKNPETRQQLQLTVLSIRTVLLNVEAALQ